VWDLEGRLDVLIVGELLGAIRTGAIGGVALKHLAPRNAATIGVVGAGLQAWAQLRAAIEVRPIRLVRIYRRSPAERQRLAERWSGEFGIPVVAVDSAREAVEGADIVISATPSDTPVVEAAWLRPGAHVSSLGPKYRHRTELGLDVVAQARRIYSDFPEQYRREEGFILHGTPHLDRMQDLVAALGTERSDQETTLFLSHGLAGTEVAVAAALSRRARELGIGQELTLS
jgi:ornithine cyclodeaminase/alanine dehydrogenase-like protein (mu-crystallin family)